MPSCLRNEVINATTLASGDHPDITADAPPASSTPADVITREKRGWFELGYRRLLVIASGQTIALVLSIALNVYLVGHQTEPEYFGITLEGRLIEMVPVSRPYQTHASVANWTAQVVTEALALDFVHSRETLQRSEKNFTKKGFVSFLDALTTSQLLNSIEQRQLVLSTSLTRSAVVKISGVVRGTFTWKVQIPIVLTAENSDDNYSLRVLLEITVVRVPTTVHDQGIGIASFIMSPM